MEGLTWTEIYDFFGFAIAATVIAGLVCPLVGTFLFVRRTGFYGIALPQFAATGVACGFAVLPWWQAYVGAGLESSDLAAGEHIGLNYHLFWASVFTFGALAVLLIGRGRGAETTRVAAAFAIASALTILFAHSSPVGDIYVHELLRGEILAIGLHEFDTLATVLGAVLLVVVIGHRDLVLISYDRETAVVLGKPVLGWELLLQVLTGATIATGVMTVGPVLLFGLLVIPPLAARPQARSMVGLLCLSSIIGALSALGGLWVSFQLDWPLGPAVVLAGALLLVPAKLAGRHGVSS
jgi:ABC-type Mn2+/Zn2+ transport system permease subunit